jgi:uncharacterized protein YwgA
VSSAINDLCDKVDRAIIFLAENEPIDKWKVQKGVFYFLWLDSIRNHYDFITAVKKIQFVPDKQGPYSEVIAGEEEMLIQDGFLETLDPESKNLPIKATSKGKSEFFNYLKADEKIHLSHIREIFEKLNSDEVVFFIYFNPYIPNEIKEYFVSKSEMKKSLILQKEKYLLKLLKCEIIDQTTAEKMREFINKID